MGLMDLIRSSLSLTTQSLAGLMGHLNETSHGEHRPLGAAMDLLHFLLGEVEPRQTT